MSVLIGLVDQIIGASDTVSWDVNKIGGTPSWLTEGPSRQIPNCRLCGRPSSLVTQLYCPLGGSPYHRLLYVFACLTDCSKRREGWTVFRSLKLDKTYGSVSSTCDKSGSSDSWLDDQDDWGEGSDDWGQESEEWGHGSDDWDQGSGDWGHDQRSGNCGDSHIGQMLKTEGSGLENDRLPDVDGGNVRGDGDDHTMATCTSQARSANVSKGGSADEEMDTAAFSQMRISEGSTGNPGQVSSLMPSVQSQMKDVYEAGGVQCSGDGVGVEGEQPVLAGGESELLVCDEGRWNAVTGLLNTTMAQDSRSATHPASTVSPSGGPAILQAFYLCVVEEPTEAGERTSDHVTELIRDYERSEGVKVDQLMSESKRSGKGAGKEAYEKSELKHGDKIFHKFLKRLQRCPKQCVRYERGGQPLLIRTLEAQDVVQSCAQCGGQRSFELQLLPPLVCALKLEDGSLSPH
ncbi:programmed cell death protein 2-like isoform X2 [Aplysia californica]|uniref:Programmed cell death protein 2-like isoform X2 n=1 Tax=Aplysia californica TaxID=6500 RepID=A0ABM0JM11_APLCA|nr:programmed cell death protein 2-like isoform X2 [Aplysia californica]